MVTFNLAGSGQASGILGRREIALQKDANTGAITGNIYFPNKSSVSTISLARNEDGSYAGTVNRSRIGRNGAEISSTLSVSGNFTNNFDGTVSSSLSVNGRSRSINRIA